MVGDLGAVKWIRPAVRLISSIPHEKRRMRFDGVDLRTDKARVHVRATHVIDKVKTDGVHVTKEHIKCWLRERLRGFRVVRDKMDKVEAGGKICVGVGRVIDDARVSVPAIRKYLFPARRIGSLSDQDSLIEVVDFGDTPSHGRWKHVELCLRGVGSIAARRRESDLDVVRTGLWRESG